MAHKSHHERDSVIDQMVRSVLTDILCSIIDEFEAKTGVRVGAVHIGAPGEPAGRSAEIEVLTADGDALTGLMQYQKILCDHELIKESEFCRHG